MMRNVTKSGRVEDMKYREITKDEINRITEKSLPREKAFFTIMRQSGLPPHRIKQLKIGDVEEILDPNTPIPCKISVLHESPNFIGEEAIKYLKRYLGTRARRENLTGESLLFTIRNGPNREINTKSVSRAFKLAMKKARIGEPSELKLYSLKDFYRENAKNYQKELSNDSRPKDNEFYRELYEEEAMPFLEIELLTPIHQLETQNKELTQRLTEIEDKLLPKIPETEPPPEYWEQMEKEIEEHERSEKWLKEHPEEQKRLEEQQQEREKENEEWLEEHPEEVKQIEEQMDAQAEQDEKFYTEHLEDTVKELTNKLKELADIIEEHRKTQRKHAKQ